MDWKIEVVPVPVTDIERAKSFYADKLGFNVDIDFTLPDDTRIIQLTPHNSGCSIALGAPTSMPPGSLHGVQIVVDDIATARQTLLTNGVDITPVQHFDGKTYVDGPGDDWNSWAFFADPDGNKWTLQERPATTT
ncbi:VOC family protein [Stackebrandtia nassauensis]|uniref:Glyoxalase/bleomycin resistance protein/dioxygenase n=1 Tax=Stackebrandtia nassauensis (strain DSM 44728 / CIP 108903 / NRRL B-16338 / NBRC 102104 / LLR-40K-21) TaxID=446470 RepID=D3Q6L8_STANL|nr:VOC family protein [Stackebrandtia nassauensis]ADD44261.1 Glyoxalase/bleomycin resistance protein/dioxygenase [Stackebrandtia nassauensis DSM 44728]